MKKQSKDHNPQIDQKTARIIKLKSEYPYKQGKPPKDDTKANDNITERKKLKRERTRLRDKITRCNKKNKKFKNV